MLAVVDSLGHGDRAADVADVAAAHLREATMPTDAGEMMGSLHDALKGTRGAAASICIVGEDGVSGCGVGNVEIRTQGSNVPVFLNPGILGQHVRQMRAFWGEARAGSRLVLFSDGVSARARFDDVRHLPAAEACRALFERSRKDHDDASLAILDLAPQDRIGTRGGLV